MKTKKRMILGTLTAIIVTSMVMFSCSKTSDPISTDEPSNPVLKEIVLSGGYAPYPYQLITNCLDTFPIEELSYGEIEALELMREEELMAKDVYIFASALYAVPIFNNISKSEEQHTSMVKLLLDRYELPDPAENHQSGIFVNQNLQVAYNQLTALASTSLIDALTAGATIEDLDLYDLQELLANVIDNQDITWVFGNLERGSRNHLRSFYGNLVFRGSTYTPQYISQEYFDQIISTPHEAGLAGCGCLTAE
jgi:hypothetical protein